MTLPKDDLLKAGRGYADRHLKTLKDSADNPVAVEDSYFTPGNFLML